MPWTARHDAFLAELQRRFDALRPDLPTTSGHCHVLADLAAETALEFGLPVKRELCMTPVPGFDLLAMHSVTIVDGITIHSPKPGAIEVVLPSISQRSPYAGQSS